MIGKTLAHYEIKELLGKGGMGEVYRAHDTKLSRDVAVKILPAELSGDPERSARFEREARTLASLQHPNVASIYGFEELEGTRFLVMEFVDGEHLAARLERGAISIENTTRIARQVATGLEAAHERGIVHRDLKPANIMITEAGDAKILDFGLARAWYGDGDVADMDNSPTITAAMTQAGTILGTAAYMSPEQARGKNVDRRSDIWAFGVILWEMVTGQRLFEGETVSDTLAAVLREEPDWHKLPVEEAPVLCRLIERCLVRDPRQRLRDIGEARILLQSDVSDIARIMPAVDHPEQTRRPSRAARWLPWAVAAVAVLALAITALRGRTPTSDVPFAKHLTIPITGSTLYGDNFSDESAPPVVSPDGRWVVFGMTDDEGVNSLRLRPIDSFESQTLPGTEFTDWAFWSPDGKHIGFIVGGQMKRLEISSGRIQKIGDQRIFSVRGGNWGPGDKILYAPNSNTGIWMIDAAGGQAKQITTPDTSIVDASHRWPFFLPDGEHYVFLLWTNDASSLEKHGGIYLASIVSDAEPVRILRDASSVAYASGNLLVMQGRNLVAVPFDASSLKIRGEGTVVTDGVFFNRNNGLAAFSTSSEGTLVYAHDRGNIPNVSFMWSDRKGNKTGTVVEPAPMYSYLRLSPDGRHVATLTPGATGDAEVWVADLTRGVRTRLVEPAPWHYDSPIWSPTGDRVMYVSAAKGTWDLYIRNIDGSGTEQPFLINSNDKAVYDWRDTRVIYFEARGGGISGTIRLYDSVSKESELLYNGSIGSRAGFSPDGGFVVYSLTEAGRQEVFVQSIANGARWQVSTSGGESPHWRGDGREIVYLDRDRRMMAVPVEPGDGEVSLRRAQELFQLDRSVFVWDVTDDHQRFLLAERPERTSEPIHVILNWNAGL